MFLEWVDVKMKSDRKKGKKNRKVIANMVIIEREQSDYTTKGESL